MNPSKPTSKPAVTDDLHVTRFEHDGQDLVVFSLPLDEYTADDPPLISWQALTKAQLEVVTLALEGHSNREIARLRRTAPSTIAKQLETADRRLGINSRRELTVQAARQRSERRRGG